MGAKMARTNSDLLGTGVPRLRVIARRRRTPNGTFLGQQSFPNSSPVQGRLAGCTSVASVAELVENVSWQDLGQT